MSPKRGGPKETAETPPGRPACPKCGMNMIATAIKERHQTYECLRCGKIEKRQVE